MLYANSKSELAYHIGKPVDPNAEFYMEMVTLSFGSKSGNDFSEKERAQIDKFIQAKEAIETEIPRLFAAPTRITVGVEIEGGKTVFTYSGTATAKDGQTVEYHKQVSLNFKLDNDSSRSDVSHPVPDKDFFNN